MKKYEIVTIEDISKMITRENFENFFTDMANVYDKYLKIKEDLPKMFSGNILLNISDKPW